jgi:citrate lyase beta subunit
VRPRRSLLFVPADRPDRVRKAAGLPTDAVIIDWEDGVDPSHRAEARLRAAESCAEVNFGHREVVLRVNSPSSPYHKEDLEALLRFPKPPDTVMVPKVDTPEELAAVAAVLDHAGLHCRLIPCVETATGVLAAPMIARASDRNVGLMFGGYDFSADIGATFAWEPLLFARSQVVLAAVAARIDPLDTPWGDFSDLAGLTEASTRAKQLGYVGKTAIHPSQLEIINAAFSPSPGELASAQRIIAAAEAHGFGAINVDGKMVDMAVVRVAERTLAVARRAGLIS